MKDLRITKGEWMLAKAGKHNYQVVSDKPYDGIMGTDNETLVCKISYLNGFTNEQVEANTKLIADAGNTAQKCGLLPSELLKQRDELLAAVKLADEVLGGIDGYMDDKLTKASGVDSINAFCECRKVIKNATK